MNLLFQVRAMNILFVRLHRQQVTGLLLLFDPGAILIRKKLPSKVWAQPAKLFWTLNYTLKK